ncbi:prephenate dehydrogenase [Roseateles paludis]|jgi:prephenate dehydrogenase|uniref:Prephenate dehydrogenase/arogenate dehydrogenase family protein n=1 Tax=Roseateles paludis TaxID=3145238 RepID=A0ABV0G3V2_9BURK
MYQQLGVIGCGLMGGSFALALKKAGLVKRVVGYSKSPSTTEAARKLGVIDVAAESALLAVSGSDIVLIAVPVAATEATLKAIRHLVNPGVLFMDVGSTKCDVVDAAKRALGDRVAGFVPCHPIAGKEAGGVANADAALYQGCKVIITPSPVTDPAQVQRATDVWSGIGAQVVRMRPQHHDTAFAAVSHLPHLLAFAYFNAVATQARGPDFLSLAGPGFRDFTRIAASEPAVWRDILLANRADLLAQAHKFREALDGFERLIESGDPVALEAAIRKVSDARASWQLSDRPSPTGSNPAARPGGK